MQDNRSISTPTQSTSPAARFLSKRWALVGLSVLVVVVGGRTGWWAWQQLASTPSDPAAQVEQGDSNANSGSTPNGQTPAVAPVITTAVQVYLLDINDINFALAPITLEVETEDTPTAILGAAFDQLLNQSLPETQAFSAIPENTALLDLSVENDGIYVDLSAEFEQGGGSASMTGRLGQVIYTATSLEPDEAVWLSVEGEPLELLGGEGLEISQPMTRDEFDANFSL